jgi:hypothetical protein
MMWSARPALRHASPVSPSAHLLQRITGLIFASPSRVGERCDAIAHPGARAGSACHPPLRAIFVG